MKNATRMDSAGAVGDGGKYTPAKDEWGTPRELVAGVARLFGLDGFDLDPAASAETAQAPKFFTRIEDGLEQPWRGNVFLNPPFGPRGSFVARWLAKALAEVQHTNGITAVLVPGKVDTVWWHRYVMAAPTILLVKGRLCFIDPATGKPCADSKGRPMPAGFPVAIAIFRRGPSRGPEVLSIDARGRALR